MAVCDFRIMFLQNRFLCWNSALIYDFHKYFGLLRAEVQEKKKNNRELDLEQNKKIYISRDIQIERKKL